VSPRGYAGSADGLAHGVAVCVSGGSMLGDDHSSGLPPSGAGSAAAAWRREMLRGRPARVVSPADEFQWFEDIRPAYYVIQAGDDPLQLCGLDTMRVALIIGAPQTSEFKAGIDFSQVTFHQTPDGSGGFNGTFGGPLALVSGTYPSVWMTVTPNVMMGAGQTNEGIPIPTQGVLCLDQRSYGSLVQCPWFGVVTSQMFVTVIEVVLRQWPSPAQQRQQARNL